MKKRILAFLLALAILCCCAVPAFAADNTVAKIYLCYRWSGAPSLGHVWVYVENLSNQTQKVGAYTLPPRQGVSIGNFGLTRSDGNGTYYNVESYCAARFSMSGTVSNSHRLSQSELNSVSNAILSQNLWLPLGSNCCDFAVRVWNAGGGTYTVSLGLPVFVKWQIQAHGNEGGVNMYSPARNQVLKQSGTGGGATLHVCADGTVSKQIG